MALHTTGYHQTLPLLKLHSAVESAGHTPLAAGNSYDMPDALQTAGPPFIRRHRSGWLGSHCKIHLQERLFISQ